MIATRRHHQRTGTSPKAFTLVELLVVIGIIALLMAILFPAFSKVRESSKQTKCLTNLKTLGLAFDMYSNNNNYTYPYNAVSAANPEDWVWWQPLPAPGRDPSQSAIGPYLNPWNNDYLRCPSDDVTARPAAYTSTGPYAYSYTLNKFMASDPSYTPKCPRVPMIADPSNKILLVEETYNTINDGCWRPCLYFDEAGQQFDSGGSQLDKLSIVHDPQPDGQPDSGYNPLPWAGHRGNVLFVDGHAEFVTRAFAEYDQRVYATGRTY